VAVRFSLKSWNPSGTPCGSSAPGRTDGDDAGSTSKREGGLSWCRESSAFAVTGGSHPAVSPG
jgi:hypothetical protein